jgi:BASS family bile acid:Na+ symporter
MLVAVGTDLRREEFARVARTPRLVAAGLILPLLALPVLALVLIAAFDPSLAASSGLLLIAACPIGGISNFYSALARASTALSVTLTGLSCLLAGVTIPLLSAVYERVLHLPLGLQAPLPLLLSQLLLMLAAPVALGMALRHRWPRAIERQSPRLKFGSLLAIGALMALIVASDFDRFRAEAPITVPLAAAFVAGSFAIGWLTALAVRAGARDRFTLAVEFATRNVAVAATVAVTILGRTEFATWGTTYLLVETPLLLLAVAVFRPRLALEPVAA